MSSVYHLLDTYPPLEEEDVQVEINQLAKTLVESGLLRIDAYDKCNFARFKEPAQGINKMLSKRQLFDPQLLPYTEASLRHILIKKYGSNNIDKKIAETITYLQNEVNRHVPVTTELEMKLARLIVQATHPAVMLLMILEGVELFISYSFNIGDMLDIVTWQQAGSNGGMQSTDGVNAAVFISCGGDPTNLKHSDKLDQDQQNRYDKNEIDDLYGDGKPAMARATIIGGQEMGHFSDMMRNKYGNYVARHSADLAATMATEHTKIARIRDKQQVEQTKQKFIRLGLNRLANYDSKIKFFRKNRIKNFSRIHNSIARFIYKLYFFSKISKRDFPAIEKYKRMFYSGSMLLTMFEDMAFNLEPKADVYSSPDKNIEEPIACIEALARIPQQKYKWGQETVQYLTPHLFHIYYNEVIPRCISDYERLTGKKFTLYYENMHYMFWPKKVMFKCFKKIKALIAKKFTKS
jgi:hypothetical protein